MHYVEKHYLIRDIDPAIAKAEHVTQRLRDGDHIVDGSRCVEKDGQDTCQNCSPDSHPLETQSQSCTHVTMVYWVVSSPSDTVTKLYTCHMSYFYWVVSYPRDTVTHLYTFHNDHFLVTNR